MSVQRFQIVLYLGVIHQDHLVVIRNDRLPGLDGDAGQRVPGRKIRAAQ